MQVNEIKRSSASLIAAFVASMMMAPGGSALAGTRSEGDGALSWPPPSTPAALPQPEPAFQGKIGKYVTDSRPWWPKPPTAPKGAPNVVIILIDDAGFAATDLFGGPVKTPYLDEFAEQGLRYNDFNVTAICSATRAALLTGMNHHVSGFGNLTEALSGYPGYDGIWKKSTASVAEVLRDNGYSTAAFGKWHNTPYWEVSPVGPFDHWPTGLGFEHFYGFMDGMDSEYEPRLFNDTTPVFPPRTPAQGYYFTTDITDRAIAWIYTHEALAPGKPYFLYFATGATHAPHHVQEQWVKKYEGRFDEGWDQLREQTLARQKQLGITPANTDLTPRPKALPAWDTLPPDARRVEARQMAVYAGYMAETDYQVGRLLKAIQQAPGASNTLIFYIIGDNGASGEGGLEGSDHEFYSAVTQYREPMREQLKNIDALGGPAFDNHYSAAWAWALDTPFKWMKQIASNFGGTRDPMIVVWPARIKDHDGLRTQFTDVDDVVPTIYQIAGITPPTSVDGVKQKPLDGTSFAYTFDSPNAPSRHRVQYFEIFGNRAIYDDGWVASARHGLPWDEITKNPVDYAHDHWRLYHVADDFSEAHDLAAKYPEKLAALKKLFYVQARKYEVLPIGATLVPGDTPSLAQGRHEFVFRPSLPFTATQALPIFCGSYRITADLDVPKGAVQGTIVSYGSRYGGFTLYVRDGKVVYDNNFAGYLHNVIASQTPLPSGRTTVTFDYVATGGKSEGPALLRCMPYMSKPGGEGSLYVNGKKVGEGPVKPDGFLNFGSLGIGRSYDSPISRGYSGEFPFTGTIEKVVVDLPERGGHF